MKAPPLITCMGFAIAFFAVGIPYWATSYAQAQVPSALPWFGILILGLVAGLLRFSFGVTVLRAGLVIGAVIPAVIVARVFVETSSDPTSHNLWPLEVVLASGIGFPVAFCGAVIGKLVAKLAKG